MAKEAATPEAPPAEGAKAESKGVPLKKLIIIGVPLFLVQVGVLFYFFVIRSSSAAPQQAEAQTEAASSKKEGSKEGGKEKSKESSKESPKEGSKEGSKGEGDAAGHIYIVKDMIVNPAGTNGTRFLLLTIGFEISNEDGEKELEKRDIQVRDVLNSVLTTKGLDELASVEHREELRTEIQGKIDEMLKSGNVTNVYFSKFIIQ